MKKKLLIINKAQFGYHTDTYKYCEHLKDIFDITYICFDIGNQRYDCEGVSVVYVPYNGSFFAKGKRFILAIKSISDSIMFNKIFLVYFQFCFILIFLLKQSGVIFDVRTASVHHNSFVRNFEDLLLKFESLFFSILTVISEGVRDKLHLNPKKTIILPLGADIISKVDKIFDYPRLIYVGTLRNRNIQQTVEGVKLFVDRYPDLSISYDIFGSGSKSDDECLVSTIKQCGLSNIVKFYGRKTHDELTPYFDKCNVGVSYVPITDYYNHQPPTKTYEYLFSGIACIATSTSENELIINDACGILCNDTALAFCKSLEKLVPKINTFSSSLIRKQIEKNSWYNVSVCLANILK